MTPRPPHPTTIGVFDSGIGGLTVYRALLRRLAGARLLYFGDTARVPYGSKSGETVTSFSLEAGEFLRDLEIEALVVACNTASAYAIPALEELLRIPVFGVVEAGAQAALATGSKRIGVIATQATIASGAYERALQQEDRAKDVRTRACPLFVPLVEEGWLDHPVTRDVAAEYLAPLRDNGVECLILGCTHYPMLSPLLQQVMGAEVRLVDGAEYVARGLAERLDIPLTEAPLALDREPGHRIFLTDEPQAFRTTSERFLGRPLPPVEIVRRREERWVRA